MAFQRGFQIDLARCIGCRACAMACVMENNTDPYVHWREVVTMEYGTYPNADRVHVTMGCFHCEEPACVKACPISGAISKDSTDGVVVIDPDLCNGCRRCIAACPYNAPVYNPATQKVEKCNFCKHRVGTGSNPTHLPACVSTCPTKALTYTEKSSFTPTTTTAPGFADMNNTKPSVEWVGIGTTSGASTRPSLPG